jgi:phytoene dehydrogenase-like protein
MGKIIEAIAASGARFGLETRVNARVVHIPVHNGRVGGVVLETGEEIRARTVIANASARHTFLDLIDRSVLPDEFLQDIRGFDGQSTAFKIHLAVEELPRYPGLDTAGMGNEYPVQVCVAPSLTHMEQAYLDMRQGHVSRRPFLTVQAPTVVDADLAPQGRHLLSIYGGHVPWSAAAHDREATRDAVLGAMFDCLSHFAPAMSPDVLHKHVLLAPDYEDVFGLPGGNPHHADLSLSQLFFRRPARHYANYTSPIAGLFLCSASNHPGGGVTGVPGHNTAKVVVRSLRQGARRTGP